MGSFDKLGFGHPIGETHPLFPIAPFGFESSGQQKRNCPAIKIE